MFDRGRKVWGYELLYRHDAEAESAVFEDKDRATWKVMANAFSVQRSDMAAPPKIMIHFPRTSILQNVPYALPAEQGVVEVSESEPLDPVLEDALSCLFRDGYKVAVDQFEARRKARRYLEIADIIVIDCLDRTPDELRNLAEAAQDSGALLLAKRVETPEQYELARSLGFDLFQGYFFQKPETITDRRLTSSEAARLKLFQLIESDDPDFNQLGEAIQADVSISYRLLTLLNSPYFGFAQKITSIRQALVLAGWKQIKNWLRVVILTDMAPKGKTSELPFLSAQRGKFLEMAMVDSGRSNPGPDRLFILGLFSLLEPMFDMPMENIVMHLPLDDDLKTALCGKENEYYFWLELISCFENADWKRLDEVMQKLKLDPVVVAGCYHKALTWANGFFGRQSGS